MPNGTVYEKAYQAIIVSLISIMDFSSLLCIHHGMGKYKLYRRPLYMAGF